MMIDRDNEQAKLNLRQPSPMHTRRAAPWPLDPWSAKTNLILCVDELGVFGKKGTNETRLA